MLRKYKLSVTTSGGAGSTTGPNILGKLFAVMATRGTWESGAADVTISTVNSDGAATQLTISNIAADAIYYPRHLVHDQTGAALTGTAGGDRCLPLLAGTIKCTIAQASGAQTGSVVIYYEE